MSEQIRDEIRWGNGWALTQHAVLAAGLDPSEIAVEPQMSELGYWTIGMYSRGERVRRPWPSEAVRDLVLAAYRWDAERAPGLVHPAYEVEDDLVGGEEFWREVLGRITW